MPKSFLKILIICLALQPVLGVAQWHKFKSPSNQTPFIAGSYANGCVAGAATLPENGKGYVTMRPSRNRNYGHPDLVRFVQDLGNYSHQNGYKILIGDMSQPRGGPMNFGHTSHQIGLDVDVWLQLIPNNKKLSVKQRNKRDFVSTVNKKRGVLTQNWKPQFTDLLKRASSDPRVARIFVNPVIKDALCDSLGEQQWLRKLRPWHGHNEHFHVRLNCPPGMTGCKDQAPIPAGSGCDAGVKQWVYDQANPKPIKPSKKPAKPRKPKVLPNYCKSIVSK